MVGEDSVHLSRAKTRIAMGRGKARLNRLG